ncbi:transposase [Paenibacillus gorillae]
MENKKTTNNCNGKGKKIVTSKYGEQEIVMPRDRQGDLKPLVVKKH